MSNNNNQSTTHLYSAICHEQFRGALRPAVPHRSMSDSVDFRLNGNENTIVWDARLRHAAGRQGQSRQSDRGVRT